MSLLNARNFILTRSINVMFTIPIVLFRCKTQRSKFPRLSQIFTKFADTVALCLCHCSHLQLDNTILHDFISVNLVYILLYQRVQYFSSTLAVISICMKTSFCKAKPYILACVACNTARASISSVRRANARISIFCHVVIMCLLSSESVNKVNPP